MSSSVCSPGQGLHSIPSLAQNKVDSHLPWLGCELAWEDPARHFGGVGRMRQSPLRSPPGGGSPVIHQCLMKDKAPGTRAKLGSFSPLSITSTSPPTDTSGVNLGFLITTLLRKTHPKCNKNLSSHPCLSPEPELYDSVAISHSLCFAQTRCDAHPEQPNFRPLGYSLDGAAILDKTDAKQKQNLKQKQREKAL